MVDTLDEMVIARYPVPSGADEETIAERIAEIREKHGIEEDNGVLQVRLVQGRAALQSVH